MLDRERLARPGGEGFAFGGRILITGGFYLCRAVLALSPGEAVAGAQR